MHILRAGHSIPSARCTNAECLLSFVGAAWFSRMDDRGHFIARTVLQRDNGIEARRIAVNSLDDVFTIHPNTLLQRFLAHAPMLREAGKLSSALVYFVLEAALAYGEPPDWWRRPHSAPASVATAPCWTCGDDAEDRVQLLCLRRHERGSVLRSSKLTASPGGRDPFRRKRRFSPRFT